MKHLKVIGAGILALGISLPVWADMTKEEVVAKIEAGLSQAQRARDHDQHVTAVEALLRAGIAPEKSVDIVKSALARNVPVAEVAMLAREVENRARDDKARAEQYAREHFASAGRRHEASHQKMRNEIGSPTRVERGPGNAGAGAGGGMGGGSFPGGMGAGAGGGRGQW